MHTRYESIEYHSHPFALSTLANVWSYNEYVFLASLKLVSMHLSTYGI